MGVAIGNVDGAEASFDPRHGGDPAYVREPISIAGCRCEVVIGRPAGGEEISPRPRAGER